MNLHKLTLHNFRNYEQAHVSFCQGINLLQGDNAQGKTNLLEALSLLSTGKSFRTPHLQDVIYKGARSFFVEALFEKDGVEQSLSLAFDGANKKILHNDTSYTSFIPLLGILPSILIVPEDISLIIGSPSDRRRFIDLHIAQIDPLYVYHLGRYYKAMKQRNALLKNQSEGGISSFEHFMAQSASYITLARKQHISEILPLSQGYMARLSENLEEISICYQSTLPQIQPDKDLAALYFLHWNKTRNKEMLAKSTLCGPHRDEIHLLINQKEAKYFGSEGQKRCLLTALLLSEKDLFEKNLGSSPLIGIDDFGTHLDKKRSYTLLELVSIRGQVFLTSPTDVQIPSGVLQKHFHIKNGSIPRVMTESIS